MKRLCYYAFDHAATGLPPPVGHALVRGDADVRGGLVELDHVEQRDQALR